MVRCRCSTGAVQYGTGTVQCVNILLPSTVHVSIGFREAAFWAATVPSSDIG